MGSKWRKVKLAIGINMCIQVPKTIDHSSSSSVADATAFSDRLSPSGHRITTPATSSSGPHLSKSKSKSKSNSKSLAKGTCAICLNTMKPGKGHAIFTAECSHSFHFQCITSNVKYGNQICPVCRAKWKEVPFQSPPSNVCREMSQLSQIASSWDDARTNALRRLSSQQVRTRRQTSSADSVSEPDTFDDDEVLDQQTSSTGNLNEADLSVVNTMKIRTYSEVSAVAKSASHDNFAVLIHLKAPPYSPTVQKSRAPIDLVTVLDVSGSMTGPKLALLKQAMGFVIQNLTSVDRLSVVAFSSRARRVFPLKRITDVGRQQALQAVNSLVTKGGTNIAEGLRIGTKVFADRRWKNPVGSIMLLSDGQDNRNNVGTDYSSLVPNSIHHSNSAGLQIPVHTFGFGSDHDATLMHSISEISAGTFSFIEAEDVIQDAFAQCIGGLLSVVVRDLQLQIECVHPSLQLGSVKAGSYQTSLVNNRMASIKVGDLYAEEERDFLVTLDVPADPSIDEMSLLNVKGFYNDPTNKEMSGLEVNSDVKIQRPDVARALFVSIEVDRQRNRLRVAEAMAEARVKAERGDLSEAVSLLDRCQTALSETVSAQAGDRLCASLSAELKEMQERMSNRRVYEMSGRAYVLSGLSSHSWQRATARGDSTDITSLVNAYQTPTMVDMVSRSQTMLLRPSISSSDRERSQSMLLRPSISSSDRDRQKNK